MSQIQGAQGTSHQEPCLEGSVNTDLKRGRSEPSAGMRKGQRALCGKQKQTCPTAVERPREEHTGGNLKGTKAPCWRPQGPHGDRDGSQRSPEGSYSITVSPWVFLGML